MPRVVSLGGALQFFSVEQAMFFKFRVGHDGFPFGGIVGDGVPDLGKHRGLGAPDSAAAEYLARLQVQVVSGSVNVLFPRGGETGSRMGLIGRLVLGEARVSVNAEHRPAGGAVVGDDLGADPAKGRPDVADEIQERVSDQLLVAFLIVLEPGAVVMGLEFLEEFEKGRREIDAGFGFCGCQGSNVPSGILHHFFGTNP